MTEPQIWTGSYKNELWDGWRARHKCPRIHATAFGDSEEIAKNNLQDSLARWGHVECDTPQNEGYG